MSARVLVLGGSGMFGHRAWLEFKDRFDTWVTVRHPERLPAIFDRDRTLTEVDAGNLDTLVRCISKVRPDVVVNCIGVVKQLPTAKDPITALTINALLPHQLARMCGETGARLIHLSTDCVFSGRRGSYRESDAADAEDLYGRTKLLGETTAPGTLTLRTSIIGRELRSTTGLVEWLLSHRGGEVDGYARAVFSGLTTATLARVMGDVIERHPGLEGLYHVAAEPITKLDLVARLNAAFRAGITIRPSDAVVIDRSLDGTHFRSATGIAIPEWDSMIRAMAADPLPYDDWRRNVGA